MHWITPSPNTARTAEIICFHLRNLRRFVICPSPFRPSNIFQPSLIPKKAINLDHEWRQKKVHIRPSHVQYWPIIYIWFSASLLTEFAGERSSWMCDAFLVQVGKLNMIHPETMNVPPWISCLNKDAHRFTCKIWKFVGEILRPRRFTAAPDLPEEAVGFRLRGGKQPIWAAHESLKSKQVKWVFCRKK
jgi:hypothetical protein